MYKMSAEREAGFFEQLVMPDGQPAQPRRPAPGLRTLAELCSLGDQLRAALLRRSLRDQLGPL